MHSIKFPTRFIQLNKQGSVFPHTAFDWFADTLAAAERPADQEETSSAQTAGAIQRYQFRSRAYSADAG
jgi:hypothetical protein